MDIVSGKKLPQDGNSIELPKIWKERASEFQSPIVEEFSVLTQSSESVASKQEIGWFNELSSSIIVSRFEWESDDWKAKGQGANFFVQIWLNHNRYMLQQFRTASTFLLEVAVASLAGLLMGLSMMGNAGYLYQGILIPPYSLISPSPTEFILPMFGLMIAVSVGLSGAPAGTKVPKLSSKF